MIKTVCKPLDDTILQFDYFQQEYSSSLLIDCLLVCFLFITSKLALIVYLFPYLNDNNVEEQMNFCNVHLVFDFVDVLLL